MAIGLEGKFWIQTSCRPGEGWSPSGYYSTRHYAWEAPSHDQTSLQEQLDRMLLKL